jgi:GDPmannose 4,6-dehydratase
MWRMLQQDAPGDYVIATGETHTVQEFIEAAFARVGLDWESHVDIDPRFFRPSEVDILCGDSSKARAQLQWQPATTFTHLVQMMVDHDLRLAERERRIKLLEDEQAGLLQVGAPPCAA